MASQESVLEGMIDLLRTDRGDRGYTLVDSHRMDANPRVDERMRGRLRDSWHTHAMPPQRDGHRCLDTKWQSRAMAGHHKPGMLISTRSHTPCGHERSTIMTALDPKTIVRRLVTVNRRATRRGRYAADAAEDRSVAPGRGRQKQPGDRRRTGDQPAPRPPPAPCAWAYSPESCVRACEGTVFSCCPTTFANKNGHTARSTPSRTTC